MDTNGTTRYLVILKNIYFETWKTARKGERSGRVTGSETIVGKMR